MDKPIDQPGGEPTLHTAESLAAQLSALGITAGDVLMVHSSLRAVGYVAGGPVAVVHALLSAVGPTGTLVVPTQTGDNSDPATWSRPPVPESWWQPIRDHTPGFDPRVTPSRHMGALPELVRTWPGALRSNHPSTSVAALGARAAEIVDVHDLGCMCGDRSPIGALERLDGRVLLLGAGWDSATALHLAEYRLAEPVPARLGAAALVEGQRRWVEWDDLALDSEDFDQLGAAYEGAEPERVRVGPVGNATARLFDVCPAVAFAVGWLTENRPPTGS